ncbi:hypothetical protein FHT70_006006 [Rhizobium sp. BK049]|uniref:hypothetical protein n=1 Tax=Rhizobium sp. BK049 TaxID=2587095 RepID=UPI00161C5228|nr:hypothetical protein [Rhizobium sp. BK049]MBB3356033.1 hypothetical protein [Rhizobium sp. BK049]
MSDNFFNRDGSINFAAICASFPEHGEGEITHRTVAGHHFRFQLKRNSNGTYDAVIRDQPPYGGRPEGPHETHRLPGPDGFAKVCFLKPARDLQTAIAVTLWWAKLTSDYIRTGAAWK